MVYQVGTNVLCYTNVAHGIHSIGCQANFENNVFVRLKVGGSRTSVTKSGGQNQDPLVAVTETQFIFSANHAVTFHTSDSGYFHFHRLAINRIDGGAYRSHDYFLSNSYIGRTTYNLQQFLIAD